MVGDFQNGGFMVTPHQFTSCIGNLKQTSLWKSWYRFSVGVSECLSKWRIMCMACGNFVSPRDYKLVCLHMPLVIFGQSRFTKITQFAGKLAALEERW